MYNRVEVPNQATCLRFPTTDGNIKQDNAMKMLRETPIPPKAQTLIPT
jgi:hypothetical protein